jgi:hypothetical protein
VVAAVVVTILIAVAVHLSGGVVFDIIEHVRD